MSKLLEYLDRKGIPVSIDMDKVLQAKSNNKGKATEVFIIGVNYTIIIDTPYKEFCEKWEEFKNKH